MIAGPDKVFLAIVCLLIFTIFSYNLTELILETPAEREMAECEAACGMNAVESFTREPAGNTICLCEP